MGCDLCGAMGGLRLGGLLNCDFFGFWEMECDLCGASVGSGDGGVV